MNPPTDAPPKTPFLTPAQAANRGYAQDRRKRRAQHRANAKHLGSFGGGTMQAVAAWHRHQARLP